MVAALSAPYICERLCSSFLRIGETPVTVIPVPRRAQRLSCFLGIVALVQLCSSEALAHVWTQTFGQTPVHFWP